MRPKANPEENPSNKLKKIRIIRKLLNQLYPNPPIPLQHTSTYTLLIAVLLSAQSTDKTVNRVTPQLFRLADNPFKMAKLSTQEIAAVIRPCGLSPRKSQSIRELSEILVRDFKGEVPADFETLESFPGVGHKTASVVMSQAFQIPAFAVDTHIHRLATRWKLSSGKNVVTTEHDLKNVFPKKDWGKLHLQMIYYGREYCPARSHRIADCPICQKISGLSL